MIQRLDSECRAHGVCRSTRRPSRDGADIHAPIKRAFGEATFEARAVLRRGDWKDAVRGSLAQLNGRLRQIRGDERLKDVEKRLALFELWRAPTDEDAPAVHEAYETAAAQARSLIIDFIRAPDNCPAGPRGYTAAELERLNADGGPMVFDPYPDPRAPLNP